MQPYRARLSVRKSASRPGLIREGERECNPLGKRVEGRKWNRLNEEKRLYSARAKNYGRQKKLTRRGAKSRPGSICAVLANFGTRTWIKKGKGARIEGWATGLRAGAFCEEDG